MRRATRPLSLERLEDRCVPTTYGNPWPDASHLTLSFAPDGTAVGSYANQLNQFLNTQIGNGNWQQEILRAVQTWAVNANVNVSVTDDGGQPFGAPGVIQGDTRFGDLRVAAYPLSETAAALEQPFDAAGGTWSGDLSFNSNLIFDPRQTGSFDLFSIALHEAGHALGLGHSSNTSSPMYPAYRGVRAGLSAEDVSRIQSLYGVRAPDRYEGSQGNDSFERASQLLIVDGVNVLPSEADITTLTDQDYYKISVGATLGPARVLLHTSGVSSLVAKLTLYDANRRVIDSVLATNPTGGDLSLRLPGSLLGLLSSTYYIKVESATSGVFGVGSYQVEVRPDAKLSLGTLTNLVAAAKVVVDNATNDSLASATGLTQVIAQTDSRFDYVYRASVSSSSDVDYYLLRAPAPPAGTQNVMTVMVWGMQNNGLDPDATIRNALGTPLAATVLVRDNGTYVLQVPSVPANTLLFVTVEAATPGGSRATGTYFLGVDFSAVVSVQTVLVTNRTSAGATTPTNVSGLTLTANQDLLFHFVLSTETTAAPAGSAVELTAFDPSGRIVYTAQAQAGESQSVNLFLARGGYTLRFRSVSASGQTIGPLFFNLSVSLLSDPVKPYQYDPTREPSGSSGGSSGGSSTASGNAYSSSVW